jgi:transposase
MDLHHKHTVFEAQSAKGHILLHRDVPTEPVHLIGLVKAVRGPKGVVIEESPMADWAMRVIRPYVDEVIICDPNRNRLICHDEDKHDDIDPGKLIELYRMGSLRAVHHPARVTMVDLKALVWAYHDQVQLVTAAKNKIKAAYRQAGIQYGKADVYGPDVRKEFLDRLDRRSVRERIDILYGNLDDLGQRCDRLQDRLVRRARRHPVTKRFLEIPGYGEIRAMTFLVVVDTPFRFVRPQKLWRYSGLWKRELQSGDPKTKRKRARRYNRPLKAVAWGAARTAITQKNPNAFQAMFERYMEQGLKEPLARLMVARQMLSVPWGMWKSGRRYDPALVS